MQIDLTGRLYKIDNRVYLGDCVFYYVFGGGFQSHPCPAMEYWIYRHRMGNKITTKDYKIKFSVKPAPNIHKGTVKQ